MSTWKEFEEKYWVRMYRIGGGVPTAEEFFDEGELAFLEALAEPSVEDWNEPTVCMVDMSELAIAILDDDPAEFEAVLERDSALTYVSYQNDEFCALVILGLMFGVACGNGACANFLGALYYMGDVVGQDYERTQELYQIAEAKGVVQAMINLGYIYEYGRVGEPDYLSAYMQYAKVCALTQSFEAHYKMGDMYSRGKVVPRDLRAAFEMYDRSLGFAEGEVQQAQPAIRIANLISDPENGRWGIPYEPMAALRLYQLAERGLRMDIAQGAIYYRRRLQEAIEGQERMRDVLDNDGFITALE